MEINSDYHLSMKFMHLKNFFLMGKKVTLWFFCLVVFAGSIYGSEEASHSTHEKTDQKKDKFNAGEMIIDHVKDAYEWHIMTIGEKHVSVYLPVILIHKGKISIFFSSKFHHGHSSYKGFSIAQGGENKGKIIHTDEDGNITTPIDLSITKNAFGLFISIIILLWIFLGVAKRYKKKPEEAPRGLQSILEPIILFVRNDIAKPSIGEGKYEKFLPFLLTLFFFIFFNNLMGLIPIFPFGANITGNISVTLILAAFTFIITTFIGNKNYWKHIFNAPGIPWWLKFPIPLMPIVELIGVFTKPFVLMVRLFANILAGHIIILGFMSLIFIFGAMNIYAGYSSSLISLAFGVFMSLLELLVAFIQAYVFTLLSALYFGMAIEEHHE